MVASGLPGAHTATHPRFFSRFRAVFTLGFPHLVRWSGDVCVYVFSAFFLVVLVCCSSTQTSASDCLFVCERLLGLLMLILLLLLLWSVL